MVQTKLKTNIALLAIIMSFVLVFALAVAVIAAPSVQSASADDTYSYMGWDEESGELVERETDSTPTAVTSSMTELSAGWYIVNDDVTIESTVNVNSGGVINLILVDGKTLTINAPYGNNPLRLNNSNTTLNIYGQAAGTGELHIESNYGCAIFASSSYVNVYGGKVYAKAQENCNGSYGIMCKTLTVYGGQVTALGYDWKDYKGIGIVGNLVMYGGEVIAKAGSEKAIYGTITAGEDIDWGIFNSTDNGSSWSTISLDENNKCSNSDYHVKVMVRAKMVGNGYNASTSFQISTAAQLRRFRDIVNGLNGESQNIWAFAILMNDIDLGSTPWTPIGTSSNKYGGTFDGKGYTIRGLYINSDASGIGFISYTGTNAKIRNLTLEGSVTATGDSANVGAFVGSMDGGLLTDCTNKATVNGVMFVGGLVGCVYYDSSYNKAKVEKSVNQGAVTGTGFNAGGIAGNNYGFVENCYNTGTVTGVNQVGGIVGNASYLSSTNFSTTSCNFNYGTISGSGSNVGNVIGSCSVYPTVESNFYLSATPNKGIGNKDEDNTKTQVLTAEQFKDATNFADWDFNAVWAMGEDYPIFVVGYGIWVGDDYISDHKTSGTGWSYVYETNTLTLTDFTYEGDGREIPDAWSMSGALFYYESRPFTINLVGTNSITNTGDVYNVSALYSATDLTIGGTGSLYLTTTGTATRSYAVFVKGSSMTVNGGTLVAEGGPAVENGTAESYGIDVSGYQSSFTMNGGNVTAIAGPSWNYSHGLYADTITIGSGIESFIAKGGIITGDNEWQHKTRSVYGYITSEIAGTAWTDIAGTEGKYDIEVDSETGLYKLDCTTYGDTYLYVQFVGGTVISIEIDDKSISYNDDAPTYTYVAKIDGVTVTDTDLLAAIAERVSLGSEYVKGSNAGEYDIVNTNASYSEKFTIGTENYIISSIVTGTLTVNKIEAVVTAPTAKTGLKYTGEPQELVNAGSTTGGTIEYKLDDDDWSTDIPTAVNVDNNYVVYYRIVGGDNYNDIAGVALSEAIKIEANDKSDLIAAIDLAENYYDSIETAYPTIAADLLEAIYDANAINGEDNMTVDEIASAVEDLMNAVSAAMIDVVEELIDAIGEVDLTKEDAIIEALDAYLELDEESQEQVSNSDDLFAALILLVEEYIDEIPDPVVYTDECKEAIEKAREYFDGLETEEEQNLVENKQKLFDAESAYKALDDAAKVEEVKALIDAIGEVEYTDAIKEKIDAAKDAFDALTEDQLALLENDDVDTLDDAVTTYEVLHENHVAAAEVIALIEQIGTVEYTETSKNKIDTAKEAYTDLTDDQKALVDAYLTENEVDEISVSETIYIDLGNQKRAKDVKDLINAIGEVKYPDSKDAIETARSAYDALTDTQKVLVDNYSVLTAAEETFAQLEKDANTKSPALSGGAIAGIVVGSVVFLVLLILLVLFLLKRKNKSTPIGKTDNPD